MNMVGPAIPGMTAVGNMPQDSLAEAILVAAVIPAGAIGRERSDLNAGPRSKERALLGIGFRSLIGFF
jgi:hypothetical protein